MVLKERGTTMTKEKLQEVVQSKLAQLAAAVMSEAEFAAKAAGVQRWAAFQASGGKQLFAKALS
jgi:hypothetical protein